MKGCSLNIDILLLPSRVTKDKRTGTGNWVPKFVIEPRDPEASLSLSLFLSLSLSLSLLQQIINKKNQSIPRKRNIRLTKPLFLLTFVSQCTRTKRHWHVETLYRIEKTQPLDLFGRNEYIYGWWTHKHVYDEVNRSIVIIKNRCKTIETKVRGHWTLCASHAP